MKRILVLFSVLLLIPIVCLSGQATKSVKGIPLANATYKTSLVNDVKGSVEEAPFAILGSDTRATIIITKYEQGYPCYYGLQNRYLPYMQGHPLNKITQKQSSGSLFHHFCAGIQSSYV